MSGDRDYPLDLVSPVRHVATVMDGADPAGSAPTVADMAASYRHPNVADVARVQNAQGIAGIKDAERWLIETAVSELDAQVVRDGDGFRLTVPFAELRYLGNPVHRASVDAHARLGDPFNPLTGGIFADNVRIGKGHKSNPPEDEVLRVSMRANGWLPGHPAVMDERGVVITGHRRLRIAAELGVEPDVTRVSFGEGDGADIQRLRLAWDSNEGVKPYTAGDRQAVAAYLYSRGWTQASIAEALDTAQQTISDDLRNLPLNTGAGNQRASNSGGAGSGRGGARKGAGRPRAKRQRRALTEEERQFILEHALDLGGTMNNRELRNALGRGGSGHTDSVIAGFIKEELARRAAKAEAEAQAERDQARREAEAQGCTHCPVHCPAG